MLTLRLEKKLEQSIENTAKSLGVSKSELIRKSIVNYLGQVQQKSPWELGKDLFGKQGGRGDLAENASVLFREKLKSKK